jgi:SAM-dependent methyltransferase
MTRWTGVAEAYAVSFGTLCAGPTNRLLYDTRGGTHLDVGCGTGDLAAAAAESGRLVTAIDSDPDMVAMTEDRLCGRADARVLEGSALDLPLRDASFTSVTANFVVNHLSDPRAGVREIRRVLCRGGRAAMTIWPSGPAAWAALVGGAFERAGVVPLPSGHLPEDLDFGRSVEGLASVCHEAGLDVLAQEELTWTWHITPQDLWRGISGGVATPGRMFLAQEPVVRQRANAAFDALAAQEAPHGLLSLPARAVYVLASRPAR